MFDKSFEYVSLIYYLIRRKKVGKNWRIILPVTNFFANYFFTDD